MLANSAFILCHNLSIIQSCSGKHYYSFVFLLVLKIDCQKQTIYLSVKNTPLKMMLFAIDLVHTSDLSCTFCKFILQYFFVKIVIQKISCQVLTIAQQLNVNIFFYICIIKSHFYFIQLRYEGKKINLMNQNYVKLNPIFPARNVRITFNKS